MSSNIIRLQEKGFGKLYLLIKEDQRLSLCQEPNQIAEIRKEERTVEFRGKTTRREYRLHRFDINACLSALVIKVSNIEEKREQVFHTFERVLGNPSARLKPLSRGVINEEYIIYGTWRYDYAINPRKKDLQQTYVHINGRKS